MYESYKALVDYEKGIINEGNDERLLALMLRALKGENLKIAFLGGSITQGAASSTWQSCYAYLTYSWWKEQFPKSEFTYINAGIGATTSHLGTARVEEEVLSHHPDFVIVEFSVNDDGREPLFQETYEGLVRRILKAPSAPALVLVHNMFYNNGESAINLHGEVGKHYQVPSVSLKTTVYPLVAEGKIPAREITPDDLHPNDAGHALLASVITYYLDKEKKKAQMLFDRKEEVVVSKDELPSPITQNAYEAAHRYRNDELIPVICEGFTKDDTVQEAVWDCFKKGWKSGSINDRIVFEVDAASIAVQYRKTVRKPAPVATLILDGEKEVILDANFTQDWGDYLCLETIIEHGERKKHTVEIKITSVAEDQQEDFYLVSLITA